MSVNVEKQTVDVGGDMQLTFEFDGHYKQRLIEGPDDIGLALRYNRSIETYKDLKCKPYQVLKES